MTTLSALERITSDEEVNEIIRFIQSNGGMPSGLFTQSLQEQLVPHIQNLVEPISADDVCAFKHTIYNEIVSFLTELLNCNLRIPSDSCSPLDQIMTISKSERSTILSLILSFFEQWREMVPKTSPSILIKGIKQSIQEEMIKMLSSELRNALEHSFESEVLPKIPASMIFEGIKSSIQGGLIKMLSPELRNSLERSFESEVAKTIEATIRVEGSVPSSESEMRETIMAAIKTQGLIPASNSILEPSTPSVLGVTGCNSSTGSIPGSKIIRCLDTSFALEMSKEMMAANITRRLKVTTKKWARDEILIRKLQQQLDSNPRAKKVYHYCLQQFDIASSVKDLYLLVLTTVDRDQVTIQTMVSDNILLDTYAQPAIPIQRTIIHEGMIENSSSPPVLVFITQNRCLRAVSVVARQEEFMKEMRQILPTVRCYNVNLSENSRTYPKGFDEYNLWTPMILLVPGDIFDRAITGQIVEIRDGVQICNGYRDKYTDQVVSQHRWDTNNPKEVAKWFRTALDDPKFPKYHSYTPSKDEFPELEVLCEKFLTQKS